MFHSLQLRHFRNYEDKNFSFESQKIVFCGENGRGKTNILEALLLLSLGKSWREQNPQTLIQDQHDKAQIKAKFQKEKNEFLDLYQIDIQPRKRNFFRNEKPQTRTGFLGQIPTLLFCPEYLQLFSMPKSERITFFDRFLVQISKPYRQALQNAHKAHRQKTKLLRSLRDEFIFDELEINRQIAPWNKILAQNMPTLIQSRENLAQNLSQLMPKKLEEITQKKEKIKISIDFSENFNPSEEGILDFFTIQKKREISARKNLITPLRDDFTFIYREKPLLASASRGETRSILLALLAAQKEILKDALDQNPVLLLDDVFSELDDDRQTHLEKLASDSQTFYTTTHPEHFQNFNSQIQVIKL